MTPRPLRVLFAFDPRRRAILLLGGDKTGEWNDWYEWAIPTADGWRIERLIQHISWREAHPS